MAAELSEYYGKWAPATGLDCQHSAWPSFAETWFGDSLTYPTGRGQSGHSQRGWTCGCGRGYAPWVASCGACEGAAQRREIVTTTGANGAVPEMGEWEDEK